MGKKLSEMSLVELWRLFPIELSEYRDIWKVWYAEEELRVREVLPCAYVLSHIGSTAVDGIWAKPIIDILAEAPIGCSLAEAREALTENGYICMSSADTRLSFNRGYTQNGFAERVFHLHLRYAGDNDELYLRDYLNAHPQTAREYEALKLRLAELYRYDRDAYTSAKTEFVRRYTAETKKLYPARYDGTDSMMRI